MPRDIVFGATTICNFGSHRPLKTAHTIETKLDTRFWNRTAPQTLSYATRSWYYRIAVATVRCIRCEVRLRQTSEALASNNSSETKQGRISQNTQSEPRMGIRPLKTKQKEEHPMHKALPSCFFGPHFSRKPRKICIDECFLKYLREA